MPLSPLDHLCELLRHRRGAQRLVHGDGSAEVVLQQGLVHGLHPGPLLARLHHAVDLVQLVLADQVPDGRVGDHDLQHQHAPLSVGSRQEHLAQDRLQGEGELGADLGLLVGRKDVDDPVDRLDGGVGVQRPEGQVARLGDGQGRLDRLQVPHLADEHLVRVLPQDRLQGGLEGAGVRVQLALVDDALLVLVDELDGVFDGDDVLRPARG